MSKLPDVDSNISNEGVRDSGEDLEMPCGVHKWRRRLFGMLVAMVVVVVALFGVELLFRSFFPQWQPARADRANFWRYDALLGWHHYPNQHGQFTGPSWDVNVRINSLGLRDREHDYERTNPDTFRVLLLGDSFGWGFGVEQDEMLSVRLTKLNPSWEVINGCVSGYSTDQEYLWYSSQGVKYAPDLVLLLFYRDDLVGNNTSHFYGYEKPKYKLQDGGIVLTNSPVRPRSVVADARAWLKGNTYLGYALATAKYAIERRLYSTESGTKWQPDAAKNLTAAILDKFSSEVRNRGSQMGWIMVESTPDLVDWLQQVGLDCGVPVLDLNYIYNDREKFTLARDGHWNPAGHREAAHTIVQWIRPYLHVNQPAS